MRIAKRLVHVLVIVLTLVVGATAAAIIVSQTAWFKNWLRGMIVRQANQYLNGTLSIERLGGNLFFGVEMENIGVSLDGQPVVAVKDLGLDYNIFQLIAKGLSVDNIRLDKPVIYLRKDGDTWSLSRLVKKQETEADRSGPARPIAIEDIGISDGSLVIDGPVGTSGVEVPKRFEHLDAKLSFKYEPVRYSVEITHVSFRGSEPAIALNALSGGVAVKDDTVYIDKLALRTSETSLSFDGAVQQYLSKPNFNLRISSDKLSIPEFARLIPSLAGIRLQPAFEINVAGPLDRLGVEMNVRSSAGQLGGKLVADLEAPGQSVQGDLTIKHLDLSSILNDPKQKSDLTATARVDVRGESLSKVSSLHGRVNASSPRLVFAGYQTGPVDAVARIEGRRVDLNAKATAYGASATANGRVTLPDFDAPKTAKAQPIAFDISGQARRLDLRKLPRQLNVPPADTNVNADYHVVGNATPSAGAAGADLAADLKFQPSTVAGAKIAAGSTAGVTMHGRDDVGYYANASVADLDLQRVGREFKVAALADDRYKSVINGQLSASGRGTDPATLSVKANGTLADTSIMGGQVPRLDFDVALASDTARVKAKGNFTGFDPAVVSGKPQVNGSVGGNVDVDATVAEVSKGVTPDSVEATARVNLDPSTVGGLEITRAALDGDYRHSSGEIRTLEVVGRDVNVTASGTLVLGDTGQSNLKLHADSPSLATIGKLVDQPVSGIAKVDATVTGNRQDLRAQGNLTGDGIKYQENGALTASSDFTVSVKNLEAETANLSATTRATFVTVGGQNINELEARTDYTNKELRFDATAKEPKRSLSAGGRLLLHPDHQEVHLERMALQSQGVQWQTAPGPAATINYGGDTVRVDGLKLVNGDQQITADGTFGKPGDVLNVTLNNIDVATVDALLLRPPQLAGRLNASARVGGSKDDPSVDANFTIEKGGFRQFRYDTFGGKVNYAKQGVDVEARLQQNASNWIEAKGYAPVAADAPRNQYDLHVDSSAIDLGLVQGFTTSLTNVTGTAQAKIDVTGTAGDPRPNGQVTIQKAAFTVAPTGVAYTDLDGRIDLQPDKVHIDEIRVLDNHKSLMTIAGDLAIKERELAGVSIGIKSSDFKVIDNTSGNVRINSDLRIAGELSAPRIEGDLGITTGELKLDEILAQVGDSAYATQETQFVTQPASQGSAPKPSPFDALYAFVHFTVPNDLVVKASELRAPGAPIGLGALNITLGGDLTLHKAPYDQPRLYGIVNTVRGTYDFQGRRFTILRDGTVRFEGLDDLDPALDLKTERVIQAVTANVNVRGRLTKPEIVLSSVPPLEEADILSLIVFNQPINQLGEGQQISLAQRAQSMALGAAAGQLAQSLGNALNLDTFELNLAPEGGGAAQVTVGQQVGQNLYLKVQQGLGDISQTNFIVEYELQKWLRLRTNILQGSSTQTQLFQRMQGSGADLLFFFSY